MSSQDCVVMFISLWLCVKCSVIMFLEAGVFTFVYSTINEMRYCAPEELFISRNCV